MWVYRPIKCVIGYWLSFKIQLETNAVYKIEQDIKSEPMGNHRYATKDTLIFNEPIYKIIWIKLLFEMKRKRAPLFTITKQNESLIIDVTKLALGMTGRANKLLTELERRRLPSLLITGVLGNDK